MTRTDPYKTRIYLVPWSEVKHLFEHDNVTRIGTAAWTEDGHSTPDSAYPASQAAIINTNVQKNQRTRNRLEMLEDLSSQADRNAHLLLRELVRADIAA